jgi:Tfp pilus tip-associated adhesin PilY1
MSLAMLRRLRLPGALALSAALLLASSAAGDDKDLLVRTDAPTNLMIVFGNSQTTQQPILGASSAWDGDADSPASKMGASKRVVARFVADKAGQYNFGLTSFAHNPNAGSITILRKHWLYAPLTTDYPSESWKEPAGTIERWGNLGSGPCTNLTSPSCTDRSPAYATLPANATVVGPFFGVQGTNSAYIYLDGPSSSATKRIVITLKVGKYGDAYTDGSLSAYSIQNPVPPHSMEVEKEYQEKASGNWSTTATTPNGDPAKVTVYYIPPTSLPPDLFFSSDPDGGKAIGFLSDSQNDFNVSANCSGWEFQVNSAPLPLVKIPRDYLWGPACKPVQNSTPCIARLMRPQAALVHYEAGNGGFLVTDHDNPGYTGSGSKYADGCNPELLGAVDVGLDIPENQVILTTRNGSQAPIRNLLDNVFDYFSNAAIDGFQNGRRIDDPNKACRNSAVILIYDNFNGCQNDDCSFLTNHVLKKLKQIAVPVYVIGLGSSAISTSDTGRCIAQNSGAILPDGSVGYFPVTSAAGLYQALADITSFVNESSKDFASSTVSSVQTGGEQMVYLATFNAAKNRSIWNGRVNGYKLDASGKIQMGEKTIGDPNDPDNGLTLPAPSNHPDSLKWNAGENLTDTPGTGATNPAAVLAPGAVMSSGTYLDNSTDDVHSIPTHFYPGRKIVFSLPQVYADPVTQLPIPPSDTVPESRNDLTYTTTASWWPALKALLGPQTSPPGVVTPGLADDDVGNALRFIWGDRDAVMTTTEANQRYRPKPLEARELKLGDTFHSNPLIVGRPADFAFHNSNLNSYQAFFKTYRQRRRVLYAGANDGLLHAFEIGVFNRDPSVCSTLSDGSLPPCYDLGTGVELFAYAPRGIMQIFKPLKDAAGPQNKKMEWTVDGAPSAFDAFIDGSHNGTPTSSERAWHTVLVGGMREGSPFEGTSGAAPKASRGTYYALDVTQPDELADDGSGGVGPPSGAGTFLAPKCLNANGDASCGKDAADPTVRSAQPARAWPTVMWEITDTGDMDASGSAGFGYGDLGETWSKPALGRVRVCIANCGSTSAPLPTTVDSYIAIFGGGFDRERLNRRGNWLYMIDVETGKTLYRVNSSCGVNAGAAGCVPTYFGSMPSEPAAFDLNGDGYLDYVYIGDLKGQMWRMDLTDLRRMAAPPGGRWNNQLDLASGSGKPFLLFQAPQPVAPATHPFYPIYFRPTAVSLGFSSSGKPSLGIAFGTGDRDDIISAVDVVSLNYKQRFYYVIDDSNATTRTESDLLDIPSATAPPATTIPTKGWFLEFVEGERLVTDSLAIKGLILFGTYNPVPSRETRDACNNLVKCVNQRGLARFYTVDYATGDAAVGSVGSDRGETQEHASFLTNPVFYNESNAIFTTDNEVKFKEFQGIRRTTLKDWKENERPK